MGQAISDVTSSRRLDFMHEERSSSFARGGDAKPAVGQYFETATRHTFSRASIVPTFHDSNLLAIGLFFRCIITQLSKVLAWVNIE